jgi:NitT/TauT family transport system substrate-binding protein
VAQEKGLFAAEGVAVTIQPHTTGKAALEATLSGQADLGTSAEFPIALAAMKDRPVSVVATIFVAEKDYGIVGRRDKGIVAPTDIKGKRVGVTLNTSGHFALDAFLNRQKLSNNDVTKRDLKPEQLPQALAKGQIDAASTWEPYVSMMREQLGDNATVFSLAGAYDSTYMISGARDYVVSHPETVKKIVRALIRAGQFCKAAPAAASEIVAKAIDADATRLRALWSYYRFNLFLDQSLILALEDETRWAMKNKLTNRTTMPNYLNHIHVDALQATAPGAVTVIH